MKSVSLTVLALAMLSSAEANCVPVEGVYDTGQCGGLNQAGCANIGDCGWQAPVPTNCVPGTTFTDSACSAACGGGTLTTTRSGDVQPTNGGDACDATTTTGVACNSQDCVAVANCATQVENTCSACNGGWTLAANACADTVDCTGATCANSGTCTEGAAGSGTTSCACATGWTGATCTDDIDECSLLGACGVGYDCANAATSGDPAVCTDHADCTASTCANSGTCTENGVGTGLTSCACASGWEGATCTDDVKDCKADTCTNDQQGTCSENGAGTGLTSCACAAGWEGVACADDIQDCTATTCTNDQQGTCSENGAGTGLTSCACASGWEGVACADDVKDCKADTCSNGGTCSENGAGTGLTSCDCSTSTGFSGATCGECAAGKGYESGTCSDCTFADREWNNVITHSAACAAQECAEGFGVTSDSSTWAATGGNCEACGAGYESAQGCGVCADVDECHAGTVLGVVRADVACGGASTCQNEIGTNEYICNCAAGWVGGGVDAVCTECPAGTKEVAGVCVQCPLGTYGDATGATACTDCDAGKYNDQRGSVNDDACTDCPDRTFNPSPQGTSISDCQACAHCKETDEDQTNCSIDRDVDCEYTAFTTWGVCDASCHEGHAHRSRSITVTQCHGGTVCPHLNQKKQCMDQVCKCDKVICKWEAHTCTNYQPTADFGTTSNLFLRANTPYGATEHDAAGDTTGIYGFDAAGITGQVTGDQHGATTATDGHDASGMCDDTSIRVYHHDEERAGEGHHCKYTASGECKCRCHALFKGNYNPKSGNVDGVAIVSGSKFDFSIPVVQDNADGTPY